MKLYLKLPDIRSPFHVAFQLRGSRAHNPGPKHGPISSPAGAHWPPSVCLTGCPAQVRCWARGPGRSKTQQPETVQRTRWGSSVLTAHVASFHLVLREPRSVEGESEGQGRLAPGASPAQTWGACPCVGCQPQPRINPSLLCSVSSQLSSPPAGPPA